MFLRWWANYRFKRQWEKTYREASPVPGVHNLHWSLGDTSLGKRVAESTARVWTRIEPDDRKKLQLCWESLQRRWDARETGLPLHMPVFGIYQDLSSIASLYAELTSFINRARKWNGYRESPADVFYSFAGMFLVVLADKASFDTEDLDLEMARRLAAYLHCANKRRDQVEYLVVHFESEKLVQKWGFDVSRPYRYPSNAKP